MVTPTSNPVPAAPATSSAVAAIHSTPKKSKPTTTAAAVTLAAPHSTPKKTQQTAAVSAAVTQSAVYSTPKRSKQTTITATTPASTHYTPKKYNHNIAGITTSIATSSAVPSEAGAASNNETYCYRCYRQFASPASLEQHLSSNPLHNVCSTCCTDFTSKELLQKHQGNGKIQCSVCKDKWFCTDEEFKQHNDMEDKHNYCYDCGVNFETAGELEDHKSATPHPGRDIQCVCGGYYPTISSLFHHVERNVCSGISPHMLIHLLHLLSNYKVDQFILSKKPTSTSTASTSTSIPKFAPANLHGSKENGNKNDIPSIWDIMGKLKPAPPPVSNALKKDAAPELDRKIKPLPVRKKDAESIPATNGSTSTKNDDRDEKVDDRGDLHPQTLLPMDLYNDTAATLETWISLFPITALTEFKPLPILKDPSNGAATVNGSSGIITKRPTFIFLIDEKTGLMRTIPFPPPYHPITSTTTETDGGGLKAAGDIKEVYRCHTCQSQFEHQSMFLRHFHLAKNNVGNVHGKMGCAGCGREFWTLNGWVEHKETGECGQEEEEEEEEQEEENGWDAKVKGEIAEGAREGEEEGCCHCVCPFCFQRT